MNIHDFLLTASVALVVGLLLGYFMRTVLSGLGNFLHRHLEPRHLRRYRPAATAKVDPTQADKP